MACAGQGNSTAAQAKPSWPVAHPVMIELAPAEHFPPLRYSTLDEQGWRAGDAPDDRDRPESDATFPFASEVSVTGTASTFDANGGPVQLSWNPYGD